jgi:hypothetical protein
LKGIERRASPASYRAPTGAEMTILATSTKPQDSGRRVPRASLTVTLLDDPEFLALMQAGAEGQQAFAAFVSLVLTAKLQRNHGRFTQPIRIVATMTRWPVVDLERALKTLNRVVKSVRGKPWILHRRGELIIRSFDKWNGTDPGWGGAREGSGRPRRNQLENQDDFDSQSKPRASVSDSVSVSDSNDSSSSKEAAADCAAAERVLTTDQQKCVEFVANHAGVDLSKPHLSDILDHPNLSRQLVYDVVMGWKPRRDHNGKGTGALIGDLRAKLKGAGRLTEREQLQPVIET